MNIDELLRGAEGKTLEFKRDLSSPEGFLKTVVAFANTAGGTLVFGVTDRTRTVTGLADPRAAEAKLANLISDCVRPRLVPDIEVIPWRRTHLLAARVYPSPMRPHHLAEHGPRLGVFVRVGSSNRRADDALIGELGRYAEGRCFDEEPLPEFDSEAVDFRAASESFAERRRLRPADLMTLGVLTRHQGRNVPTVGGLLLFGKDRLRRFPDAWIQVGRFAGRDRRTIIDTVEVQSPLLGAVDDVLAFLRRYLAGEVVIAGVRSVVRFPFPPVAMREAIVNAIVHADYSQIGAPIRVSLFDDRLEVESPGLLPWGLTLEDVRSGVSRLRNRVIARVFHELGMIERWGSGIPRMTRACDEAGLASPLFEEVATHFRVTLFAGPRRPRVVDEVDRAIVAALAGQAEGLSTSEVARRVHRTARTTRTRLEGLVGRGIVVEVGTGPTDPKRRYFLAAGTQP